MITSNDVLMLRDYFNYYFDEDNDNYIFTSKKGENNYKKRPYYMTLSLKYSDEVCMRVKIGKKYYYFG